MYRWRPAVIPGNSDFVPVLSANTLKPSFGLKGEYASENEAIAAFNALTDVGTPSWSDMGAPLKANQVWVIRTGDTKYAKIRTTAVSLELTGDGPVARCTFQWVYQPDGSTYSRDRDETPTAAGIFAENTTGFI